MSSGDKKLNVVTKRILGWQSFKDNLLDYLDDHDRDLITQVFKTSGTFVALTLAASGTDEYAIAGYGALGVVDAIDGLGNMLDLYNRKTYNDNVPFENITGQDYHVAIRKANLPQGITVSQEDGQPNFDTYEEIVGWEADPDAVTDNMDGTITFQVDSVTESGVTNAGRTVAVYKKIPGLEALTETIALETLVVAWAGGENRITTAADFGQTNVSTTASDYRVVLLGPRTSRDTDLRPLSDWCFVGIVDGKTGVPPDTFDTSDQELIDIPFSDWAHIVRYESVPPDRLKIEVEALAGESGVDQIRINHLGTGVTFKVDEAGNMRVGDLLPSSIGGPYDLGASGDKWEDLYINGTANINIADILTATIGGLTVDGTSGLEIKNLTPRFEMWNTSLAVDNKRWLIETYNTGDLRIHTVNDVGDTFVLGMEITRVLNAPKRIRFPAADSIEIVVPKTPASAGASGYTGEICWDSGFIYVCVAPSTWKKVAIATW